MLAAEGADPGGATATLSYELNGSPVQMTVPDAASQDPGSYTLGCTKSVGYYRLSAQNFASGISFSFYTDSLTVGDYTYTGSSGEMFFISHYMENEHAYAASDYLTFTITSYKQGRISGNFSGELTPMIPDVNSNYTPGPLGSTKITKGVFQNVPVFY